MEEAPSFRVSPQQEQLWVADPEGPSGKIQAVVELERAVEPATLRAALERLVERHEILRTTFARFSGIRVPLQVIHDSLPPSWEELELRGVSEAERKSRIASALNEELRRPLDFEHGPLVHALFVGAGDEAQTFVLTLSSLCADDSSVEALLGELAAVVAGDDLVGEPLQYADFSEWQHDQLSSTDDASQAAKAFWERAAEAPTPLLPLAKAAQGAPVLDEVALSIDGDLSQAIVDLAARYTSTPQIVAQAAWHAFLSRVTAQDDLVVTA